MRVDQIYHNVQHYIGWSRLKVKHLARQPLLSKTVLLVDDFDLMRQMIREYLESLGMHTLHASSGAEAVKIAAAHGGVIDLLLTDIEMPEMSGWQLAEKIAESRPDVRVLYMSASFDLRGYNSNHKAKRWSFIHKPFPLKELKLHLHHLLMD